MEESFARRQRGCDGSLARSEKDEERARSVSRYHRAVDTLTDAGGGLSSHKTAQVKRRILRILLVTFLALELVLVVSWLLSFWAYASMEYPQAPLDLSLPHRERWIVQASRWKWPGWWGSPHLMLEFSEPWNPRTSPLDLAIVARTQPSDEIVLETTTSPSQRASYDAEEDDGGWVGEGLGTIELPPTSKAGLDLVIEYDVRIPDTTLVGAHLLLEPSNSDVPAVLSILVSYFFLFALLGLVPIAATAIWLRVDRRRSAR